DCVISTKRSEGLDQIISLLKKHGERYLEKSTSIIPFRERHKVLLEEASARITQALDEAELELAAENLRLASDSLGRICGKIDVEDMLDTIFSTFCIGK